MYTMYILKSTNTNRYYIGSTDNIKKRLEQHNKGYSRFTKGKGPFIIMYTEEYATRSEAVRREYYLKSLKSRVAIDKLIRQGPIV